MDLMNAYHLFPRSGLDLDAAVVADRQIQLGDLVVLRIVRIKIILTVKFTILVNLTVGRKAYRHRIFNDLLIQYRKRTRHTGAHRTGMGIRRASKCSGASAENLCLCRELHMDLQSDHGLILSGHLLHHLSGSCCRTTAAPAICPWPAHMHKRHG